MYSPEEWLPSFIEPASSLEDELARETNEPFEGNYWNELLGCAALDEHYMQDLDYNETSQLPWALYNYTFCLSAKHILSRENIPLLAFALDNK
jgi:hypothetical protein